MRCFLLLGAILAIPLLVGSGAHSIAAPRDRLGHVSTVRQDACCLQRRIWAYPGNCQFSSYSQCMATASGTYAYCGISPVYAFEQRRSRAQSR